ncbi:GntR family transcriptional regulator [Granulosicoccus sp. 3-233]|uniref:GntR family transcriptional regulator n=1 Tax=Granulosicoccus sp. 3-233 TaxID=3417969 RepID=UPI003D32CD4D
MAVDKNSVVSLEELLDGVSLSGEESLTTQIHGLLWQLIVTFQLKPGQMISEKELSRLFKASKTPVREAIIRLEEAGLVNIVPKSGTYVSPVRIGTYIEACFIRLQLEIGAVRRAAAYSREGSNLGELDAIMKQQTAALESDDQQTFFALDEGLHATFFRMAGVPGAWDVLRRTQAEVYRIRHLKRAHRIRRGEKVLADHHRIVEAIRLGDADLAEKALVEHIGPLEGEIRELSTNTELLQFIETQGQGTARSRQRG